MNKQLAEFVGTFALVFFGCGAAVVGGMGTGATAVDLLGHRERLRLRHRRHGLRHRADLRLPRQSGGQLRRVRRRPHERGRDGQLLDRPGPRRDRRRGVLYLILSGKAQGWDGGLGQNGWGAGYLGEYNMVSAFVFEVVGTFLFLVCILGVTHPFAPTGFAGLAIGLTLVVIHLVGINITGTSVNPARSIGPALVGIASNPGARRAALALHHRAADRRRRSPASSSAKARCSTPRRPERNACTTLQPEAWRAKSPPCFISTA